MEILAPGHMGSVYVELSLNTATVARFSLARALIEGFNSRSGSSSNVRVEASNPHRVSFIYAELVGRFRNYKLSSTYAGRASKIDDNAPGSETYSIEAATTKQPVFLLFDVGFSP